MVEITKDDVLQNVGEMKVGSVRLQFTDILGIPKNVEIPVDQLEKALDGDIMFDGSSIEGFVRIEESDMILRPDPNTFRIYPWKQSGGSVARVICDVYTSDGKPFEGCPRCNLKRVLSDAGKKGLTMHAGPEIEFFLFLQNEDGTPSIITHDHGGYFDLSPADLGEEARQEMVIALQEMEFGIEASHHEVAPGQHEIDFKYDDVLNTADNIMTFRLLVRVVAHNKGLYATFLPKPIFAEAGSGMHTHISLFQKGENAFYDPDAEYMLSKTAMHFIGGLLKHARGFTAITNPLVNSYKRLVPGYEAPVYIAWAEHNRSPLIRIPARRGVGTRVELRNPDPSCNPYLAMAVILAAGMDGIKNKMDPGEPVNQNIYDMSKEEIDRLGIQCLPANLGEALTELEKDKVIKSALGKHICQHFTEAKLIEWQTYQSQVSQWEIDNYLSLF